MAKQFTEKQRAFIEAKARGLKNRDAAVLAGYADGGGLDVMASAMMRRADIKAAIKVARAKLPKAEAPKEPEDAPSPLGMQRDHYADPMDFLTDLMNHPTLPLPARAKAAEILMPYKHGRVGEKGKKEKQGDAAGEVARKSKFRTQAAPSNVVKLHG